MFPQKFLINNIFDRYFLAIFVRKQQKKSAAIRNKNTIGAGEISLICTIKFTQKRSLFFRDIGFIDTTECLSEADLVGLLEENAIGDMRTIPLIIENLYRRDYVDVSDAAPNEHRIYSLDRSIYTYIVYLPIYMLQPKLNSLAESCVKYHI